MAPAGVAWDKVLVQPYVPANAAPALAVASAAASIESPRGAIHASWRRAATDSVPVFTINVTIPVAASAMVTLPLLGTQPTEAAVIVSSSGTLQAPGRVCEAGLLSNWVTVWRHGVFVPGAAAGVESGSWGCVPGTQPHRDTSIQCATGEPAIQLTVQSGNYTLIVC